MAEETELSVFDLRYESYRMRNRTHERRLLDSIMERGIQEPLEGVDAGETKILLNGFKRYRCAKKLNIGFVPYVSLGDDEATGIIGLIRTSNDKSLGIVEQARFIEDLRNLHKMAVMEIAETLSRSKGWVSMRLGLIGEMTGEVQKRIFSGAFPVYAYMYTIRRFMRMNGIAKQDIEAFVVAVSGKRLSIREIEYLAHGYFTGPSWFAEEIRSGNLAMALERMKQVPDAPDACNAFERSVLNDLEILGNTMRRVVIRYQDQRLKTRAFSAQANLLAAGVLSRMNALTKALRALYDRTGQA
jgi:hypothetical protein